MKTKLTITNDSFKELLNESIKWRGYDNFKSYQEEDDMEFHEFLPLRPKETGVPVEILLDDGSSYQRHEHPLFAYFKNGYNREDDYLPISVSYNPQIMAANPKLKISNEDFMKVKAFIRINKVGIENLATEKIRGREFYYKVMKKLFTENLNEDKALLLEMPIIEPEDSGLDVRLWIDGTGRNVQHGPRIKFQASNKQKYSTNYSSLSISDDPQFFNLSDKITISNKELERIRKFVIYNKESLLSLQYDNASYWDEFIPNVVKIDDDGNPIYPKSRFEKPIQSDFDIADSNLEDFLHQKKIGNKGNVSNIIKKKNKRNK